MLTVIYGICAVIGGTVMACQFIASLAGFDGDSDFDGEVSAGGFDGDLSGDVDHGGGGHDHHGSTWFFGVITLRTLIAALAFFGLAGLGGQQSGWPTAPTFGVAVLAGLGAMYGVHWLMRGLNELRADGTAHAGNSVGCAGTVYLRIPAKRGGVGKVQVSQQSRTVEYEAVTSGDELPVGANIVVVDVVGSDKVEVELQS